MSSRRKVWLVGLPLTASVIGPLSCDASSRDLSIPLALVGLSICALIAEVATLRSPARIKTRSDFSEKLMPADGVVDILNVSGIEAIPNSVDSRWRRFLRITEDVPASRAMSSTNPALLGRIGVISVFVGRDGRGWSDSEIARAHQSLERAGLWIEREASRRDQPVNIDLADVYFLVQDDADDPVQVAFGPEGDDFGPMEADASVKGIVGASRAAAQLGFVDVVDFLAQINSRIEADARIWLFHLRRAGRSLAIPAAECDVSGVGLAVCYAKESSFPEPLVGSGRVDPVTVAHELLHLFGASDKYGVSLQSFPQRTVTSRDIMRLNNESLSQMTIDPLTASEIGWAISDRTGT